MTRNDHILAHVDRQGLGLEIGPGHSPIAPKRDGFRVQIVDYLNQEQLREKFRPHGVDLDRIEEVDFVWQGGSYADLTGRRRHYDWIVASHVIEHVPDLVGFLRSCDEVLKEDGVLALAIPDKRYCFDHFRPHSGLASVIDRHRLGATNHSPGAVAEYFLNVVKRSGQIAWGAASSGPYSFIHTREQAQEGMAALETRNAYLDIHAWCFVPHSFRLLVHDLHALGLTDLREVSCSPTVGCEFYVTLGRRGTGPAEDRLTLLQHMEEELAAGNH